MRQSITIKESHQTAKAARPANTHTTLPQQRRQEEKNMGLQAPSFSALGTGAQCLINAKTRSEQGGARVSVLSASFLVGVRDQLF